MTIQNDLFKQCLAAIPEEQKAEFEFKFGIAERISEVLKAKKLTQKDFAQKLHKRESEISDITSPLWYFLSDGYMPLK